MRVLFIRPNKDAFGFKPIGLSLLSALCLKEGHKVRLFDTTFFDLGYKEYSEIAIDIKKYKPVDLSPFHIGKTPVNLQSEVERAVKEYSPDVICFSLLSDEKLVAREISGYIRGMDPGIPILWGGIHPTVAPEEVIGLDTVDYACVGEGIEALPELLGAIENGVHPMGIANIWAKDEGKVIRNDPRPMFLDLDSLPYLDWDIFDPRNFIKPFDGRAVIGGDWMSNWGCPYRCTYCINNFLNRVHRRAIRRYSPERAIEELSFLKEKHHLNFMRFFDEDFLMRPVDVLRRFAKLYEDQVGIPFSIETNPRSVTREKVEILKKMGIGSASLAIESGNDFIRQKVLKRADTKEDIVNAFRFFHEAGIRTASFNMIGLPFEDRSKVFDTIEMNRKAGPTVANTGFFFAFEKTELYDVSVGNGFYNPVEVPVFIGDYPALDQPTLSREEARGLYRCFSLYVKLPKSFYPIIERAEGTDPVAREIFSILSKVYDDYVFEKDGFFHEECDPGETGYPESISGRE